ncbi:uncharacterized protein LOC118434993 isoform X2 [Folsomia candida]|uniref:uncharacterized protein LOC118434993 isoform X2 n=1 Tax=Folsomia candida TaxID=158441 RepID=UPI001604DE5F|nr:uncharacterized protein LOC118434993 isoform X2 [Folsomia candida]
MLSDTKGSVEVTARRASIPSFKKKVKNYKSITTYKARTPASHAKSRTTFVTLLPDPKDTVKNITCLSSAMISDRKAAVNRKYQKQEGSCPHDYPCKSHNSCSLWKTGLVGEDLAINQWISLSFLEDIFLGVDPKTLHIVRSVFQDCIHQNGITIPISKVRPTPDCESRVQHITDCLLTSQNKGLCNNYNAPPATTAV